MDFYFVSTENKTIIPEQHRHLTNLKQIYLDTEFYEYVANRLCQVYTCTEEDKQRMIQIFKIRFQVKHNLSELKTFSPFIFNDYLKDYDYVGWTDVDIAYGDISMLYPHLKYDFITISVESDVGMLYLRGPFTIMRNRMDVLKSFSEYMSLDYFFKVFKPTSKVSETELVREEGGYSKYIVKSKYSTAFLPFRSETYSCRRVIHITGHLECLDYKSSKKFKPFVAENPVIFDLPDGIVKKCNIHWVPKEDRMCIKAPFGFTFTKDGIAKVYRQENPGSYHKMPLLYHYQFHKAKFRMDFIE
eukprot:NODE_122_length_17689_cov_1.046219.p4 type:complete len:301 gc:universal NODE_122_length_17689_cov_1.046219:12915-13817(+)